METELVEGAWIINQTGFMFGMGLGFTVFIVVIAIAIVVGQILDDGGF